MANTRYVGLGWPFAVDISNATYLANILFAYVAYLVYGIRNVDLLQHTVLETR